MEKKMEKWKKIFLKAINIIFIKENIKMEKKMDMAKNIKLEKDKMN
jgi:hypothetical protein